MAKGAAYVVEGRGACVAGETATAADGTYPTGMHSCCKEVSAKSFIHLSD